MADLVIGTMPRPFCVGIVVTKEGVVMDVKDLMRELADRIERTANVRVAFGEPVGEGMDMVIPVARVSVRGGGGGGMGDMPEGPRRGKGSGIGLGMNIVSSPVGYIRRTAHGAEFVPIVDKNRMIIVGAVLAGLCLLTLKMGLKAFGR
jgi:uncharacterized spore protein YtfJ